MERLKHVVQVNILFGAWLVIAPFVLGYSGFKPALTSDVLLGIWLIGCSWWILAAASGRVAAGTLELLGAIWLVAAPFVLHYQRLSRSFDNDIAIGILTLVVSAAATWMLASRL